MKVCREECKASLLKRKFWKVFDPEVLDLYVVSNFDLYTCCDI